MMRCLFVYTCKSKKVKDRRRIMDHQIREAAILLLGIWLIIISWITLFNLNYAIAVRIVNGIPFLWIAELFQIFQSGRAVLFYVRLVMKGLLINLWMFAPAGFLMPLAFPAFRNGKRVIAAGLLFLSLSNLCSLCMAAALWILMMS